mgnify:FL=1
MIREWIAESAWIAKYLPGVGNPMSLPIDEFNGYLDEIIKMLKRESGSGSPVGDHRSFVDDQMRRIHG